MEELVKDLNRYNIKERRIYFRKNKIVLDVPDAKSVIFLPNEDEIVYINSDNRYYKIKRDSYDYIMIIPIPKEKINGIE